LRDGEVADPFWVKKAGLQALPLVEALGMADPENFFDHLERLFPQLKEELEKKKAAVKEPLPAEKVSAPVDTPASTGLAPDATPPFFNQP